MGRSDPTSVYPSAVTRSKSSENITFKTKFKISTSARNNIVEQMSDSISMSGDAFDKISEPDSLREFRHHLEINEGGIAHNSIRTYIEGNETELATLTNTQDRQVERLKFSDLASDEKAVISIENARTNVGDVIHDEIFSEIRNELSGWKIVAPFRDPGAKGEFGAEPEMDPSGKNLTTFLQSIREDGTERYEEICDTYTNIMEGVRNVRIVTEEMPDGNVAPYIRIDEANAEGIGLDELSSGAKEILILITQIITSRKQGGPLYIEEPELHLHPAAERQIYSKIKETVEDHSIQIMVTTHSDTFLHQVSIDNIHSVKREDYTYVDTVEEGQLGDILADIGYTTSQLLQADRILFVEGRSDRVVFLKWAETLGKSFDQHGVEPIIFNGDELFESDNPYANEILDLLGQMGIPYQFVFDSDGEDPEKRSRK